MKELKDMLKQRRQKTSGKKIDLIERLNADDNLKEEERDNLKEEERNRFKVFIKTITGSFHTVYIAQDQTILDLKNKIDEIINCPINKQILYYLCNEKQQIGDILYPDGTIGKKTKDNQTLLSLGVNNESFFYLHAKLL